MLIRKLTVGLFSLMLAFGMITMTGCAEEESDMENAAEEAAENTEDAMEDANDAIEDAMD